MMMLNSLLLRRSINKGMGIPWHFIEPLNVSLTIPCLILGQLGDAYWQVLVNGKVTFRPEDEITNSEIK